MYFAFLFVLRSVIKAGDILVSYNFNTGNVSDDTAVRQLIANLVGKTKGSAHPMSTSAMPYSAVVDGKSNADRNVKAIEECKHGFDESEMFQVYIFCFVMAWFLRHLYNHLDIPRVSTGFGGL
jgi:hypothetical protein